MRRLMIITVVAGLVALLTACVGTADLTLATLAAEQEDWSGSQVRTEGVVRGFDDPEHHWIEDDVPNRVELVDVDGLDELIGETVRVEGRFTFREDEGRRISVERIEVVD